MENIFKKIKAQRITHKLARKQRKVKRYRESGKYTDDGFLYLKIDHPYVRGIVGKDVVLPFRTKLHILFSRGVSVMFIGRPARPDEISQVDDNMIEEFKDE